MENSLWKQHGTDQRAQDERIVHIIKIEWYSHHKTLRELVEKHERIDLQIDYLTKQIESCEERVSNLHRDRSNFESRLGSNNRQTHKRSVSQVFTLTFETS